MADVEATFEDTVNIDDSFFAGNVLRTQVLGRIQGGDHDFEPAVILGQFIYNNWTCDIPLSQIGYNQFFTGYGDIIIKYKEIDSTIVGGMTDHPGFMDSYYYGQPVPYHTRIEITIEVRADNPDPMPPEMNKIKVYIKNFIRARPQGLKDEGYQSLELTEGYFNAPEQRDKYTYKTNVQVMMKEAKTYR